MTNDGEINILLKESEENLANLMETISKTSYKDFYTTIKTEQVNYEAKIKVATDDNRSNMMMNLKNSDMIEAVAEKPDSLPVKLFSTLNLHQSKRHTMGQHLPSSANFMLNQNEYRILLVENLLQEFKYKTEENNYSEVLHMFESGEQANEESYNEFIAQEAEVD